MSGYVSKAIPTKIMATSRVALKIKDNYYTVEYSEERSINPDDDSVDMEKERELLFDAVNNVVDEQAADIVNTFRK